MSTSLRPTPAGAALRPARRTPTTPREMLVAAAIHGLLAMAGAVAIAMIAMLLFWIMASGGSGSAPDAIRSGALVVLAACHGGLRIDGADVTLMPVGLTFLVALPCWRAGLALGAAVPSGLAVGRRIVLLGASSASFAAAALVLALVMRVGSVQARPLTTALGALLLFAAGAAIPFGRATARQRHPLEGPLVSLIIVRAAAAGLAVLIGCAALVGGASLALSAGTARTLSEQVGGGGLGGLPLAVLGALFVPNAVIASLSYLAGPGFAIGTGASVTASGAAVGAVPAFPLLAALPADHGANPAVVAVMVLAPLAAGAAIVRLLWLRLPYPQPLALILGALGAALLCGAAMSVLAALSGGGLGPGRLSQIGPPALLSGAVVAAELAVAAALALGALGGWTLLGRRQPASAAAERDAVAPAADGVKADDARVDDSDDDVEREGSDALDEARAADR